MWPFKIHILSFLFGVYQCFACMYEWASHSWRGLERVLDPRVANNCEPPRRCGKLGPSSEQPVLLTIELPLQPFCFTNLRIILIETKSQIVKNRWRDCYHYVRTSLLKTILLYVVTLLFDCVNTSYFFFSLYFCDWFFFLNVYVFHWAFILLHSCYICLHHC